VRQHYQDRPAAQREPKRRGQEQERGRGRNE
jgi:hypothetical protein